MFFDVVIVGAGPAGLFAAFELVSREPDLRVLVIDEGGDVSVRKCPMLELGRCIGCKPCHIMSGVGGAGGLSDGTINLRPDIGGDLSVLTGDVNYAWQLVWEVDEVFLSHNGPRELFRGNEDDVRYWEHRAAQAGIKFIPVVQRHIGSDRAPAVFGCLKDDLVARGVRFSLWSRVLDFGPGWVRFRRGNDVLEVKARAVLVAPGRGGADWLKGVAARIGMDFIHGPIDVGVRVEVPAIIMEPITDVNHDPKFHIYTDSYDDFVRTFCMNPYGFVVEEKYDGYVGVNGHSLHGRRSNNTNFAFLSRIELTEPVEDSSAYGKKIAELATTIGGGKPVLQRLGDLRRGRRSSWSRIRRGVVEPTLRDVTPGDVAMALPHRVVTNIIEGLEKLDRVLPGVAEDYTLLYAPEIKYYAIQVQVDENLESSVDGVFVAGDGAGLSRDIVNAAATGLLAARGILKKFWSYSEKDFRRDDVNWRARVYGL